jgi:hypothetical protein
MEIWKTLDIEKVVFCIFEVGVFKVKWKILLNI